MVFSFQKVKLYSNLNNPMLPYKEENCKWERELHSMHLCAHSHTYANETILPSMEKYAYPSPTSSVVGKCLNESMKKKNQKD